MSPYIYRCVITRVIDGDTVDMTIDVGFRLTTVQRVRLLGVNTAEMNDRDPELRAKALAAKVYVESWVANNPSPMVHTFKADSFGRWLGVVYNTQGQSLNQRLVDDAVGEAA